MLTTLIKLLIIPLISFNGVSLYKGEAARRNHSDKNANQNCFNDSENGMITRIKINNIIYNDNKLIYDCLRPLYTKIEKN
jgi:hypothetical protein